MPQLLTVRFESPGGRRVRIWVPVLPVVLVFSPIVVLVVLGVVVACLVYHVSVVRALGAGWRFICALPGYRFDVEESGTALFISIR